MMNGTLPGDPVNRLPGPVLFGEPECWQGEECGCCTYVLQYQDLPRVTASYGYNHSAPGGQVVPPLDRIIVGVRPLPATQLLAVTTTSFTITITSLPRVLTDGVVIESSLAPCDGTHEGGEETCRQYFTVPVRGYDILHVRLVRTGDNISNADGSSNGGRGLVGRLYVGTGADYGTPPPVAYDEMRPISNLTTEVEVGYFCTVDAQAGDYTVAVVAGAASEGGFGPELMTTAAEAVIDSGVARQGRGRYALHVRHASFEDGHILPNTVRSGCVSYGQRRNYTLVSTGVGDANLYVAVRDGNVSSLRARCEGCEWITATPPHYALGMSPCDMRASATWHVEVTLDDATPATLAGLTPTEFTQVAEHQNATVAPGDVVASRTAGGTGYVCCGATLSFLMPDVPRTHAVAASLNVTDGSVRAIFLKHGACARPSVDIEEDHCAAASCEMRWLTVFDEFYGTRIHSYSSYLSIPFGATPWEYDESATVRRAGDWYISIASLPGQAAEFRLDTLLLEPAKAPEHYKCNRFLGFCPKDHYHFGLGANNDLLPPPPPTLEIDLTSGASPRTPARDPPAAFALGVCLALWMAPRRWHQAAGR